MRPTGRPGSFEFYYSTEDTLLTGNRAGIARWAMKLYPTNVPLWALVIRSAIKYSQKRTERVRFTYPARGAQAGRKDGHAAFFFGSERIGWANNKLMKRGMMRKDVSLLPLIIVLVVFAPQSATAQRAVSHEGMIEPYVTVNVASQVSGILEEMMVKRGDIVAKGQVLATLRAGVEKADLEQANAMLDFNRRKLERNRELVVQGNVSANDEDEMATEVRKNEAILHQVTAKLEMKTIRSPVDGVVVKVDLSGGEYVGDKPIMTIAQIDPLNVEVVVPVSEYGTIKKGMLAEVRPEYPVGGVYTGKVTIVDHVVNAASGSFGARVGNCQCQPRDPLRAEMQRQVQG